MVTGVKAQINKHVRYLVLGNLMATVVVVHIDLGIRVLGSNSGLTLKTLFLLHDIKGVNIDLATGLADELLHPAGKDVGPGEALGDPGLTEILVLGGDTASGDELEDVDDSVDGGIGADTSNETVGDRVREGHEGDGQEGGDGVSDIVPVDGADRLDHHRTNDHQGGTSGPWREGGKDGGEEEGDEEEEGSDDRGDTSATTLSDTGAGLDKGSDRGDTKDGANGDGGGIAEEGSGRAVKVTVLVHVTSELGHGVESTGGIHNIDVQEGDQGDPNLGVVEVKVHLGHGGLNGVEGDDLLEEVKLGITGGGAGEVGEGGVAEPGHDRDDQDSDEDSTLDTEDQANRDNDETKETDPGGDRLHLVGHTQAVLVLLGTSGQGDQSVVVVTDQTDTGGGLETDEAEVETDTGSGGNLDGLGDQAGEPLTDTKEREEDEQDTLDKDGSNGSLVRDLVGTVETDDSVGKVGVKTHTGGKTNGQVGEQTHQQSGEAGNGSRGGDHVELQGGETVVVSLICHTHGVSGAGADTGSTGIRHNEGVDRDNVGLLVVIVRCEK